MRSASSYLLLVTIALRNLWLYRFRTLVTAGLLGFGAFLAVFGLSLLRDIESSMRASITGSFAGHLQIYSDAAKDDLALFGGGFMGRVDIGTLPDLVTFREVAMRHPNVDAFVPMGLDMALLGRGNEADDAIDALRAALKTGEPEVVEDRIDQVRFLVTQLKAELAEGRKLRRDQAELDQQAADLAAAEAPEFLTALRGGDETSLMFLETRIAPLSGEKAPIYLNYLGTDIGLFTANFAKFKVVEGEPLPPGRRGILISRKVREDWLKNMAARIFDRLKKKIDRNRIKIAGDAENERWAADLPRQYESIVSHLDRAEAQALQAGLDALGIRGESAGGDVGLIERLAAQLKDFLRVDDANFHARYDWFYANVAPKIRLYEISPGETITLRSYTRSGYVKSVPLKVFGVYSFDGLEDSDLAGVMNIIDLVSFRELYGQMTESALKELEAMRAAAGVKELTADSAEDALFGAGAAAAIETRTEVVEGTGVHETIEVKPTIADAFDEAEARQGLALNAAILLKDPDRLPETQADLSKAMKDARLSVRVVDWQTASGIVGQFVNIVRMALIFAIVIIFVVALVIINNSIIVSTLNRIREIGTMRAIGAQKSFVVGLFLAETGLVAFLGAVFGALAAGLVLTILQSQGLAAPNDVVAFLFSGPRLYPMVRWPLVLIAPVVVAVIAVAASVYAARHAAQVKPAEAMQEKE